jgi:hypothetical protein
MGIHTRRNHRRMRLFHDREEFGSLCPAKLFGIMKRSIVKRRPVVVPEKEPAPPMGPPAWATAPTAAYQPRVLTLGQLTGYRVVGPR